ncbi:MAG TPA: methyltransferase domain-containing protein [Acidimicrobiia bacterium]|jgi:SAM-dependent methyltransferase
MPERDTRVSYRIDADADQVEQERARLLDLAAERDPATRRILEQVGVGPGWACCDVGSGAGTIASWLATRVMPGGRVVALDVDTRFHQPHPGVELREQDVTATDIGDAEYDLVHARGVLQHVAQREEVLDKMVAAAKPGGWVVLTDSDWVEFDAQPIPEPFGELSRLLRRSSERVHGYDPTWGRRLLPALQERGLIDVHVDGAVYTMHGGTPSAEWYVAGLARAVAHHRELGTIPDGFPAEEALAQARDPGFAILSPISLTARARRPQPPGRAVR